MTADEEYELVLAAVRLEPDPERLRSVLLAVLDRVKAERDGARRQMAEGDYRLCPPDMLAIYVADDATSAFVPYADRSTRAARDAAMERMWAAGLNGG